MRAATILYNENHIVPFDFGFVAIRGATIFSKREDAGTAIRRELAPRSETHTKQPHRVRATSERHPSRRQP